MTNLGNYIAIPRRGMLKKAKPTTLGILQNKKIDILFCKTLFVLQIEKKNETNTT